MRRSGSFVRVCACLGAGAIAIAAMQDPEEAQVRQAFEAYRAAVLADDGEKAVTLVAESGIQYFADMQQLALYGSPDEVRAQSMVNQVQILTLRHRMDKKRLRDMSARDLFVHAVGQGWTGKNSVQGLEIGSVTVSGDRATADMASNGRVMGLKFAFVKQGGRWRWDLVPVLAMGNMGLKEVARRSGIGEEDLIISLLESVSGRKVPPNIWDPLFRKPGG